MTNDLTHKSFTKQSTMKMRDEICIWRRKRVGSEFRDYTARGDEAAVRCLRAAIWKPELVRAAEVL